MQRKAWIVVLFLAVVSTAAAWSAFTDLDADDKTKIASNGGNSGFGDAFPSRPFTRPMKAASGLAADPVYELADPIKYPAANEPVALAVGDVTGDGLDDVAVITRRFFMAAETHVIVYAQLPGGGLGLLKNYQIGGANVWGGGIRLGDLNNDAVMDIVASHSKGLTLLTAQPGGEFAIKEVESSLSDDLGVIDVDRDGQLDVVAQSFDNLTTRVFYGDGEGGVRSSMSLPGSSTVSDLEVGDVTGDGLPDVVTSTRSPIGFEVRPLDAAVGFAPLRAYPATDIWSPNGVAIGDFNTDGRNDVALTRGKNSPTQIWLHYQDTQGTLGPPVSLPSYDIPADTFAADLNRDGRSDLVVSHSGWGQIGYYLQGNEGLAAEKLVATITTPLASNIMAAGDMNNDGCGDLVYVDYPGVAVRLGGNCQVASAPAVANDVDGDGKTDMLWRNEPKTNFAYWLMDGAERRAGHGYPVGSAWNIVAKGDFNGDGALDLVWSDGQSMQLWQRYGDGYQGLVMPAYPQGYRVVATGDVNGDGKADLLWRDGANTVLALWVMDGESVTASRGYWLSPEWRVAGAGDLSGDRRLDLVVSNGTRMELWRGARNLLWDSASMGGYPVGWDLSATADIDGDGRDDLLWRHAGQGYFVYWRMRGPRRLEGVEYRVDGSWRVLGSGDYSGDGKADIVWTNGSLMQLWASGQYPGFAGLPMPGYPQGWTPQ